MNKKDERISVRFLPRVSASHTPARGPNGQPKNRTAVTRQPERRKRKFRLQRR